MSSMKKQADAWINPSVATQTMDFPTLKEASDTVYNVLLLVALIVALIVGAILGIQIMISGVEQKAKAKESLVPYLISCVVTFGAFGIWKFCVVVLGAVA